MSSPWSEPEERGGMSRGSWIGLGILLAVAAAFAAYAWFGRDSGEKLDPNVIIGEWQATDPPWHLTFRPDRTVELTYAGTTGPETLAPTVMTPGVPVPGKFIRAEKGLYRLVLDNGKAYEAAIGRYKVRQDDKLVDQFIENRLDLTDAEGSSGVVEFQKLVPPQ